MIGHILIYLLSFAGMWIGTGIAISSVEKLSRNLKLSSFTISFIILGLFTSLSEFSVGANAVIENDPEIFVGNLIGASIVIFMLIVPLLAITGGHIHINREFRGFNLIMSLVVIATPVLLSLDGVVDRWDALIAIVTYTILLASIHSKSSIFEKISQTFAIDKVDISKELVKILVGVVIIFTSSHFVVEQTLYFSDLLRISPFLVSLLIISIGTNVPELSLVIRSKFMKNSEVAFGDYVGSAAFNTYLWGLLTIWYGKSIYLTSSYLISLVFLIIGLISFYVFARTKNMISRWEGLYLLILYIFFLLSEVLLTAR